MSLSLKKYCRKAKASGCVWRGPPKGGYKDEDKYEAIMETGKAMIEEDRQAVAAALRQYGMLKTLSAEARSDLAQSRHQHRRADDGREASRSALQAKEGERDLAVCVAGLAIPLINGFTTPFVVLLVARTLRLQYRLEAWVTNADDSLRAARRGTVPSGQHLE